MVMRRNSQDVIQEIAETEIAQSRCVIWQLVLQNEGGVSVSSTRGRGMKEKLKKRIAVLELELKYGR